jgi:hypothetical protein
MVVFIRKSHIGKETGKSISFVLGISQSRTALLWSRRFRSITHIESNILTASPNDWLDEAADRTSIFAAHVWTVKAISSPLPSARTLGVISRTLNEAGCSTIQAVQKKERFLAIWPVRVQISSRCGSPESDRIRPDEAFHDVLLIKVVAQKGENNLGSPNVRNENRASVDEFCTERLNKQNCEILTFEENNLPASDRQFCSKVTKNETSKRFQHV